MNSTDFPASVNKDSSQYMKIFYMHIEIALFAERVHIREVAKFAYEKRET